MATRGRKPANPKVTDIAERRLTSVEGGKGQKDQAPPARKTPPKPPAWLKSAAAKACWARLVPDLLARHQYIPLFEIELGRYCIAFATYVEAQTKMKATGGPVTKSSKGVPMLSQWWVVANRAHETMIRLAADLGLNPVAQVRLSGLQLDLFNQPGEGTGNDGAQTGTGFDQFRR